MTSSTISGVKMYFLIVSTTTRSRSDTVSERRFTQAPFTRALLQVK